MKDREHKRGREIGGQVNIKQLLEDARAQLEVGELLASSAFDLQTAMTAREIGDPKMDRCGSASDADLRSCAERIAAGEGRLDLQESEVLAVMDRLLQMEIGWHDRFFLCQTVYTSLYTSSVGRIKDALPDLYVFCLSVNALSTFLYDAVYSNRVCCDEDVTVTLCGVPLCDTGADQVIGMLEDRIRERSEQPKHPITQRLLWRYATLKSLLGMANALHRKDLEIVASSCDDAIAMLDAIEFLDDAVLERAEGFVPTLYYGSLGHAPIRDVKLRPVREAAESWKAFLSSLKEAACLLGKVNSWTSLKSFLDHIAARDYHGFIRCLIYHALVHQPRASWAPSQAMIARDILLMSDIEIVPYQSEGLSEQLEVLPELAVFFQQSVLAIQGLCHVKCLNRARQHRRLRHSLRDWMNIMGHAFNAETTPEYMVWVQEQGFSWDESGDTVSCRGSSMRIAPLTLWVVYETSWSCIERLLMGGPLQLYQPQEISTVFWYVSYLMGSAEDASKEFYNISRGRVRKMRSSRGASSLNDGHHRQDISLRGRVHEVLQMAVDSISMTSVALQSMDMSQVTTREFNDRNDSYDQRFGFMKELEFPRYQKHEDYLLYEHNVTEFAGRNPAKLAEEALYYTVIVHKRLISVAETASVKEELHMSQNVWATAQRTLVANMTALKLLVTMLGRSKDLSQIASQYSVSWKFEDDIDDALASQSREGGFALVCLTLPKLHVAHAKKKSS